MQKFLFGEITHCLDPKIREVLIMDLFRNENSTFDSGP